MALFELLPVDPRLFYRRGDPNDARLGELVAHNLSHLQRMASIVPAALVTYNSQTAAQQLGTELRVFDNEADALAWIGSDAGPGEPLPAPGSAA